MCSTHVDTTGSVSVMQQEMGHSPYYIVIGGLLALQNFSTLSHKRHEFGGGMLLNIRCVFGFLKNFV